MTFWAYIFTYMVIIESPHWDSKICHSLSLGKQSARKTIAGVSMFSREVKLMMNLTFRGQGQFIVQL